MCSSPPVRKREECDLPRFLPSPCESAHILKLNPHAGRTTALRGDYKLGGDYQIAPWLCQSGGFCVTETQKGCESEAGKVVNKHVVFKVFLIWFPF